MDQRWKGTCGASSEPGGTDGRSEGCTHPVVLGHARRIPAGGLEATAELLRPPGLMFMWDGRVRRSDPEANMRRRRTISFCFGNDFERQTNSRCKRAGAGATLLVFLLARAACADGLQAGQWKTVQS